MEWGRRLEGAILQSLADELEIGFEQGVVLDHPTRPYCISPDAFNEHFYGEVKNLALFKRKEYGAPGSSDIEKPYFMQCMHGLGIMADLGYEIEKCHFRALFGGQKKEDFYIYYDAEMVQVVWEIIDKWYQDYVVADTPPPPDASKAYADFLKNEFKPETVKMEVYIESDDEMEELIDQHQQAAKAVIESKELMNEITNRLCSIVGHNHGIQGKKKRFVWYPVAGRISDAGVIHELMKKYGIPKEELEQIKEKYRGDPNRVPRVF
jgi:predicted phage-related endonuclease